MISELHTLFNIKYPGNSMQINSITATAIRNKTVLVRTDYNVPLEKKGGHWQVADESRITASLPTLKFLIDHQSKVLVVTHLGRPDGKPNPELSLQPVAERLSHRLGQEVVVLPDLEQATEAATQLKPGQVALVENIRFWPEEEANDAEFSKKLAQLAEVYVNEAFSAAHRAHASVVGITNHLPSFAGFGLAEEIEHLGSLMNQPKRPFVMVIGGKKISDKVEAVVNLTNIADVVLLGGGTANNFLKADGFEIYKSVVEEASADHSKRDTNYVKVAEHLLESTKQDRMLIDGYIPLPKILYPTDVLAAPSVDSSASQIEEIELVNGNHHEAQQRNLMYLDLGPKTIKLYKEIILQAGTVFWNGPMGVFEKEEFADGTRQIAKAIAKSSAETVLGGGDTIAAVNQFGLSDRYDYLSAAGGAALEFLAGKQLPGLKPLTKK